MRAAYNGHEALTFTDYLDLGTGKTLRAEPGGVYDLAPASGRVVPDFPEPWFTAAAVPEVAAPALEVAVPVAKTAAKAPPGDSSDEA